MDLELTRWKDAQPKDHALINKRNTSSVMDVRTFRGADCETDHFLVCMKYRSRIMRRNAGESMRPERLHTEKLKAPEMKKKYENKLGEALETGNMEVCNMESAMRCAVEETWMAIKNAIKRAGEDVLGTRPKKKRDE